MRIIFVVVIATMLTMTMTMAMFSFEITSIKGQNVTDSNTSKGGLYVTNLTNITDSTALKSNELIMNSS